MGESGGSWECGPAWFLTAGWSPLSEEARSWERPDEIRRDRVWPFVGVWQ